MAEFGVTGFGFVKKTRNEILEDLKSKARDEYGNSINTDNDSLVGQTLAIYTDQLTDLWEGLEGVYNAQTINGAEGIYLDDVLSLQGINRRGKQKSTGLAYLTTNGFTPNNTDLDSGTTFLTNTGERYLPVLDIITITNNVIGSRVHTDDVILNEVYSVTCISEVTGTTESISVTATTDEEKYTLVVQGIYNFLTGCHPSLISLIQLETIAGSPTTGACYLGYDTNLNLQGLSVPILFAKTPQLNLSGYESLGTRITRISVEAEEAGIQNVTAGSLNRISPEPIGFDSVTNINSMSEGAGVETDAAYRFRYNQIVDSTSAATRDAIEGALLQVNGVTKVRIYENTTPVDTPEADSYSFNSVVLGGIAEDITQTLFDKKPINVKASGTTCVTVLSSQNDATVVCYSPATEQDLSVRITYTTKAGTALTQQEQLDVAESLENYSANLDIGDTVFIGQLQSYIYNVLGFDRLIFLQVELKEVSQPDSSYASSDYTPDFDEVVAINNTNITYIRQ
jgi:uncharacterized phage protein gp47/JayE